MAQTNALVGSADSRYFIYYHQTESETWNRQAFQLIHSCRKGDTMAAYVVVDVEITDLEKFKVYSGLSPGIINQFGGKYVVRGGATETVEGNWYPGRLVIVEFENMEQLKKWYNSVEYSGPKGLRKESANSNLIFVEGIS